MIECLLITGRSISKPICSRSLNPSMSGMWTSLITISNPFLFSRSIDNAVSARLHLVTGKRNTTNQPIIHQITRISTSKLQTKRIHKKKGTPYFTYAQIKTNQTFKANEILQAICRRYGISKLRYKTLPNPCWNKIIAQSNTRCHTVTKSKKQRSFLFVFPPYGPTNKINTSKKKKTKK